MGHGRERDFAAIDQDATRIEAVPLREVPGAPVTSMRSPRATHRRQAVEGLGGSSVRRSAKSWIVAAVATQIEEDHSSVVSDGEHAPADDVAPGRGGIGFRA